MNIKCFNKIYTVDSTKFYWNSKLSSLVRCVMFVLQHIYLRRQNAFLLRITYLKTLFFQVIFFLIHQRYFCSAGKFPLNILNGINMERNVLDGGLSRCIQFTRQSKENAQVSYTQITLLWQVISEDFSLTYFKVSTIQDFKECISYFVILYSKY